MTVVWEPGQANRMAPSHRSLTAMDFWAGNSIQSQDSTSRILFVTSFNVSVFCTYAHYKGKHGMSSRVMIRYLDTSCQKIRGLWY